MGGVEVVAERRQDAVPLLDGEACHVPGVDAVVGRARVLVDHDRRDHVAHVQPHTPQPRRERREVDRRARLRHVLGVELRKREPDVIYVM